MTITAADQQLALHNLQAPEVIADPVPYYTRLRTSAPVYFDPFISTWLLSRHIDVKHVLTSPDTTVQMRHTDTLARFGGAGLEEAFRLLDLHVSFVDDPEHRRLRRTLAEPVQVRKVRTDLTAPIDTAIDAVLDAITDSVQRLEPVDVATAVADQVPILVTQQLLGIHDVDITTVQRWSHAWSDIVAAPGHVPTGNRAELLHTVAELIAYLQTLIDRHTSAIVAERISANDTTDANAGNARESMITALVSAMLGGSISRDELLANLLMLITAGNETTANLIANSVMALADDPALWRLVTTEPDRIPDVIEEVGRLFPPTQFTARRATAPLTLPSGDVIPVGASVVLILAAANRDPDAFSDPDRFLPGRPGPQPVTYGYGPHLCFGAPLARQETRRTLERLASTFLHLTPLPGRAWRRNGNLRGLQTLPVRLHRSIPGTPHITAGAR
ncbi:cytochrome P450 [Dactylosporangium sp. NPDC050688]|uniref:cytochrome P450 n=1 Tax=Dactylosporangium sp. NPDC050688 TaxID=3157217 RepID=UPI003404ABDD